MSKRALLSPIVAGIAFAGMATTANASFVLKPGQTKQYRCGPDNGGHPACIKKVRSTSDKHWLKYLPNAPVAG